MLTTGKALKVTVYLSDGARHKGVPVYTGVLDFLFKHEIAGAIPSGEVRVCFPAGYPQLDRSRQV